MSCSNCGEPTDSAGVRGFVFDKSRVKQFSGWRPGLYKGEPCYIAPGLDFTIMVCPGCSGGSNIRGRELVCLNVRHQKECLTKCSCCHICYCPDVPWYVVRDCCYIPLRDEYHVAVECKKCDVSTFDAVLVDTFHVSFDPDEPRDL